MFSLFGIDNKKSGIKIMGTFEIVKKNSLVKYSSLRVLSNKAYEKLSKSSSDDDRGVLVDSNTDGPPDNILDKVKFEIYGEEMITREVKLCGNTGRVYLPPAWIGKHIKVVRID